MNLHRSCAALLLAALLAGCHSASAPPATGTANTNTAANTAASQPVGEPTTPAVDELNNPNSPLAKRNIYFDFDSYTVKSDYQSLLRAHADYLRHHPGQHVLIQGNTDERGSDEYNLALGERRSQAVLHELETLGVPDSQIEAVSLGKEKPVALGHDEASWAQNRRADLVYQPQP
ncbi:peptidoglycan-associated lipoprotein Pal [Paraburkholderia acidipaludis]|uniref:peptidoglycan-associated lipoprotein Pal n=1 Tax=Paraburkholderia acidipaludis TaxID=660537 RepID=UPI00047F76ED|nr:peptidoglycan-associated lipoprotein Pal [Paraburkholderia acidipaludis]